MNKTGIEWCDYTWNPIVGCSPASAGCLNCYAEAIAKRFNKPWGHPVFMPSRLGQPAKEKKPGRVFVCSMSDIGHEEVKPEWRTQILNAMLDAPWHTFIILTKRPDQWLRIFSKTAWVGITAENQEQYDRRWLELTAQVWRGVATKRFVSVEPMLEEVHLRDGMVMPDWVIAGPETGKGAREFRTSWIGSLAFECKSEGVPFFDKRGILRREFP